MMLSIIIIIIIVIVIITIKIIRAIVLSSSIIIILIIPSPLQREAVRGAGLGSGSSRRFVRRGSRWRLQMHPRRIEAFRVEGLRF